MSATGTEARVCADIAEREGHAVSDVTLIDGRTFPESSVLVRHEREVMADHLANMRRRTTASRREYLDGVERSQGRAWRDELARRFTEEWEASRK